MFTLTCENLHLEAQGEIVFSRLSFSSTAGTILYIRGSNGSGKSSLLRIIAGIQLAEIGDIKINNVNINQLQKSYISYIGHELGINLMLSVKDNLLFWAKLYDAYEGLDATIFYFGLQELLESRAYDLSAGNRKKLALARLFLANRKIWLLDEIDNNLDESNKLVLYNAIISKASMGGIVIIASHSKEFTKNAQILYIEDYA